MKYRTKINGVEIVRDDGNAETSEIEELDGELIKDADNGRIKRLIHNINSMGYRVIDKKGKIVNEEDI